MVIGDPSVGKTSLIRRFVEKQFSEDYLPTIGINFLRKNVFVNQNTQASLILWDVAGQAKYTTFKKMYYVGSDFIIIVFDITNIRSYYSIKRWLKDVHTILGEQIEFAIFANKIDMEEQRQVLNYDNFKNYTTLFEIAETSAKTGQNVDNIFLRIAKFLIKKFGSIKGDSDTLSF